MDREGMRGSSMDPGAFYRGMFQHPDVAFFVIQVSPEGHFLIEDGNKALEKWLGHPIDEMKGRPVRDWLAPPGIDFLESNLRIAIEKRASHSYDRAVELAGGALSWSTTLIPVIEGDGPVTHIIGVVRDIVHDRPASGDTQRHRALTDQRHRLVETLHEATGQHLAAAHLALRRLEIFATPEADRGKDLDEALDDAKASIEEAKREIGVLTYVMRPPVLDSHDFGRAVRIFAEGFGRRSQTAVELLIAPGAFDLPLSAAMPFFRILQEAFANVHRHARAKKVTVTVEIAGGELVLTVADNGVGFDARKIPVPVGGTSGLAGMRAHMVQLGGSFEIGSGGVGTTIIARSPLAACTA
jgi:PAS domain S-box-containing protein